jgi:hypothetical protein
MWVSAQLYILQVIYLQFFLQNPKTRIWVQVDYLGNNTGNSYREVETRRKEGSKNMYYQICYYSNWSTILLRTPGNSRKLAQSPYQWQRPWVFIHQLSVSHWWRAVSSAVINSGSDCLEAEHHATPDRVANHLVYSGLKCCSEEYTNSLY